jgi:hypothetical protein
MANAFHIVDIMPGVRNVRLQETAMVEHGVRKVVLFGMTAEDLASEWTRFPWGLMQCMTKRIYDTWTRGATGPRPKHKTMRVTASNGTDLTARYDPRYVIHNGFVAERLLPGQWCPLAGATVGIELFVDANGRLTFDGLHGEEEYKALPPVGSDVVYPLSEPVHWFFKDRKASIEGGAEAEVMRRIVAKGGPFATILCEIALGEVKGGRARVAEGVAPEIKAPGETFAEWFAGGLRMIDAIETGRMFPSASHTTKRHIDHWLTRIVRAGNGQASVKEVY